MRLFCFGMSLEKLLDLINYLTYSHYLASDLQAISQVYFICILNSTLTEMTTKK